MKKLTLLILATAFASLSSCQTVQGLGRDVQNAGSGLQNAAQNVNTQNVITQ